MKSGVTDGEVASLADLVMVLSSVNACQGLASLTYEIEQGNRPDAWVVVLTLEGQETCLVVFLPDSVGLLVTRLREAARLLAGHSVAVKQGKGKQWAN